MDAKTKLKLAFVPLAKTKKVARDYSLERRMDFAMSILKCFGGVENEQVRKVWERKSMVHLLRRPSLPGMFRQKCQRFCGKKKKKRKGHLRPKKVQSGAPLTV